jgi:hypothetical protein
MYSGPFEMMRDRMDRAASGWLRRCSLPTTPDLRRRPWFREAPLAGPFSYEALVWPQMESYDLGAWLQLAGGDLRLDIEQMLGLLPAGRWSRKLDRSCSDSVGSRTGVGEDPRATPRR